MREKAKLSEELAKEAVDKRLSKLLMSLKTDEISEKEINAEVEKVRAEIYAREKRNRVIFDTNLFIKEKAKADLLITGDNDLLVLEKYKKTKIITCFSLWREIKRGDENA